ncbi:MAG TPA: AAA family ATPase [Thermomicrobiales bacterium]|nr:AAA family ATPase [Thermomicrobiales bacterium]
MPASQLPDAIVALLDPAIYPHPVERVELVQTHISFVLLAGDYVYKIKKPVDFGFLNFSTLPRRRYYCQQEVTLNQRLCPGVYLDVTQISSDGDRLRLGKPRRGERIVEYAVRMRRLPSERMMDHLLERGELTREMVERLAERIADFHGGSERGPKIDRYGSPRVVAANWRENFEQAAPFAGDCLSQWQFEVIEEYVDSFLTRNRELLRQRVRNGHIRDCHGDLRTSAICFTDDVCVYDCIEFNRRFRYSDVASEVAFLAMDLDRRGHRELAETFARRYTERANDPGVHDLLDFYCCYRSFVRGKVAAFRLSQPEVSEAERAESVAIAEQAFHMACEYATRGRPLLLIACGLSGSGKSALARGLAEAERLTVIASDVVRKEISGVALTAHRRAGYSEGIYAPGVSARTYATMLERGRECLAHGASALLDATFLRREDRERARSLAHEMGALFACLECVAPEDVIVARLQARERDASEVSDARVETYYAQKRAFEPVGELPERQHVVVDMARPLDEAVAGARGALRQRWGRDAGRGMRDA